jgi:cytidylate kinase
LCHIRQDRAVGRTDTTTPGEALPKVVLVTGLQAAGKSTVGPLLAARLGTPSAAFDGDVFYRMVAAGNVDMTPEADPEAVRQVRLRYDAAALVAQHYAKAGFDFVYTDIVLGEDVTRWIESIKDADRHLVVLDPSVDAIVEREIQRGKTSYRDWQKPGMTLADAVASMQRALRDTPRRGLWLDSSSQTPDETVEAIVGDLLASSY